MTAPIQQAELADARKGALFFLGTLTVERKPRFDFGLISNFMSGTSIVTDLKNASRGVIKQVDAGQKALEGIDRFTDKMKDLLASFFDTMTEYFGKLYGESSAVIEWVGEFGSWAVSELVGSLSSLIPGWGYVQGAADLYDGVKQSVLSAIKWLGQVFTGWGVPLLEGSPTIISEAIARHNATALAGGLKDTALSVTKISLQAAGDAAAGVGSIIGMVTGILQRIANLVGYCVQRFLLARTIKQAQYGYNKKTEIMTDQTRFNEWFRRACVCTPIIAALTMQSGCVANPLRFLALFTDKDEVISQEQYDAGVKHIHALKDLSRDYCRSYADAYKLDFHSGDSVFNWLLKQTFS